MKSDGNIRLAVDVNFKNFFSFFMISLIVITYNEVIIVFPGMKRIITVKIKPPVFLKRDFFLKPRKSVGVNIRCRITFIREDFQKSA